MANQTNHSIIIRLPSIQPDVVGQLNNLSVEYRKTGVQGWTLAAENLPLDTETFTLTDLEGSESYSIRVAALSNTSAFSSSLLTATTLFSGRKYSQCETQTKGFKDLAKASKQIMLKCLHSGKMHSSTRITL